MGARLTTKGAGMTEPVGGTFRGDWNTDTRYRAHDQVAYAGSVYVASTTHTSGATFDPAKFAVSAPASGAVLLNPPLVNSAYVGNVATPPLSSQGGSGNPWLALQQPYSAGDNNPDAMQFFSTASDGTTKIKTAWWNGNGEYRAAPSAANRIGARIFEYAEGAGGPSTGRFFELSTNPSISANREPLLGGYGTGHPTKPGWIEATRVLSALLGVSAGGAYNSTTGVTFRGLTGSPGAPTTGTWAAGDAVIDSTGALLVCTGAGTPGTWTGSAWTDLTLPPGMLHGTVHAAARLEPGGIVRVRGSLSSGVGTGFTAGVTIATLPAGRWPATAMTFPSRQAGAGIALTINTDGTITSSTTIGTGGGVVVLLDNIALSTT